MTITANVKAEKGVANLKQAGNDFKDAASSQANSYANKVSDAATDIANTLGTKAGEFVGNAGKYIDQASSTVKDVSGQLETRVQEKPISSILAALGLGAVIGMLLRK